jgi:hypothetical protein
MIAPYLVAFSAMVFAALSMATIVKVVDSMWRLGE